MSIVDCLYATNNHLTVPILMFYNLQCVELRFIIHRQYVNINAVNLIYNIII